jgi:hypothetical protein
MTRMRLTTDSFGRVTITYIDKMYDEKIERTFTCPTEGGYVLELLSNGATSQPCDRLARTGNTLLCASRDDLPALIRSEYRKMRR